MGDVRGIRKEASEAGATTLISFVYDHLRRDIIAGKYAPEEKLKVEPIRNGFGVAASTVREALARLTAEGLVTAEGQRGFHVAPMSRDDLLDITRLRMMVETEALVESIRHGDVAWECRVVAAFHNLTRAEERLISGDGDPDVCLAWEEANKEFHRELTSACQSPRLLAFTQMLYRQHERYRMRSLTQRAVDATLKTRSKKRDVHAEHEGLMSAAVDRDADAARTLLTQHIQKTVDFVAPGLPGQPAAEPTSR